MSSNDPAFAGPSPRIHRLHRPGKSVNPRRPIHATAVNNPVKINSCEVDVPTADNSTIKAYFSTPAEPPTHNAAVLLLSDIVGYGTAATREVADRLAGQSLPTFVPDLFRGNPWPGHPPDDTYEAWRQTHPVERIHSDIAAAVAALRERGVGTPLGLIGFCFGGGRLMHEISLGTEGVNPAAVAAFYPTRFDPVATGKGALCPLFFVTGDQDPLVPEDVITTLRETLDEENDEMEDCEMIIVEGAGHGFAHRPKTEEDKADSEILLEQATQWLSKYLLR